MIRVLGTDNAQNTFTIQGAFAHNSNVDICKFVFQNFDADTNSRFNMAQISMRDQWGNASENGAGNLLFHTNPNGSNLVERMRVQYDGKVGIGCTPNYMLDVNGSINASGFCNLLVDSYNTGDLHKAPTVNALSNVYAVATWSSNYVISASSTPVWTSTSNNVYIFQSNIGIGTSNPSYTLDAKGSVFAQGYCNLLVDSYNTTDSNKAPTLTALSNVYATALWSSNRPWTSTNNTTYILQSNVGIGTSNPSYTLDIKGSVFAQGYCNLLVDSYNTTDSNKAPTLTALSNVYAIASWCSNSPWTASGSNSYTLQSNVGIGTCNPSYTLDVKGSVFAQGYCNLLVNSFNSTDVNMAPTLTALSNVYGVASWCSNYPWTASGSNSYILQSNVGIGTTNPGFLLDVHGDVNVESNLIVRNVIYNCGREFFYGSNFATATGTTGTTFINRFSLSTNLEGGKYLFLLTYAMQSANNQRVGMGRVVLSNSLSPSNIVHLSSNNVTTTGYNIVADQTYLPLPSGSNIFTLQYCVNTGGGNTTISIKDSKMSLLRIM